MATAEVLAGAVKSFQDDGKGKNDESTSLEPKDFFWDQFLKYISSAILALTVLNVSVEFLRGGGVQCFPPTITKYLTDVDMDELDHEFSIRQSDYFNSFCSESIPPAEFYPIYILVQGLLLVAPHFIWGAIFKGDFDSFFAVTKKLDRLRDRNTGMYDSTNFDRVEKLELEFGSKRRRIFFCYILKLLLQLVVCVGTVIFSETFFVDFSFTFQCPMDFRETAIPENWPLNTTIPCVFASLRVLSLVRYADYILTGMAIILIALGLGWCAIRHTKELGHVDIANFVFQSCLTTKTYVFPPFYEVRPKVNYTDKCWFCCFPFALCCFCCKGCIMCSFRFMLFTPRIRNDLDFLQMTLFRADSSHGRVFKEIQIDKELQKLHGKDHQLIHLFLNVQLDMEALINKKNRDKAMVDGRGQQNSDDDDESQQRRRRSLYSRTSSSASDTDHSPARPRVLPREIDLHHIFKMGGFSGNPEKYAFTHYQSLLGNTEWRPVEGIRDRLYGFVKFCPKYVTGQKRGEVKTEMAMDISFGSSGYALVLARAFQTVVSVNFRPFFRNEKQPVKNEKFYTNYVNVDFPENIFTHSSDTINEAVQQMVQPMFDNRKKPVDFIMVGPFVDDTKRVTVTLTIEMLYTTKIIEEGAILLAVRPLQIGHRKTAKHFLKYEPPVQLFDHSFHEKTVLPMLRAEAAPDFREVDGFTGVTVKCGDTNCVFEFVTYKYIGDVEEEPPQPKTVTLAELLGTHSDPTDSDQQPVFIEMDRSQSLPASSQFPDARSARESYTGSDRDPSTSLPPTAPPRFRQGGVYDIGGGGQRRPPIERRHTVDLSPHVRSLQRQETLEAAEQAHSAAIPDNDRQAHFTAHVDSNRLQYSEEPTSRLDGYTRNGTRRREIEERGGEADAREGAGSRGDTWTRGTTQTRGGANSGHSVRPARGGNSSGLHRAVQRPQLLSSTSTPLSSIEEDEINAEVEVYREANGDTSDSAVTSPPPVFEDGQFQT